MLSKDPNAWETFQSIASNAIDILWNDFAKAGRESEAFSPMGTTPGASAWLAESMSLSTNYTTRKLGAMLAGWISDARYVKLLPAMLDRERKIFLEDEVNANSVGEDIMFSATRYPLKRAGRLQHPFLPSVSRSRHCQLGAGHSGYTLVAMKPLSALINPADPAMPELRQWISQAVRPVEVLPAIEPNGQALFQTQVTTRSPMGAIVYETGGILIDHGWLRILGGGHPRLKRALPAWNQGRSNGFYLVADDAAGGFFAINGAAFGTDVGQLYYFAPDSLRWEPMGIGYSTFLNWVFSKKYDGFCADLRWPGWEVEVAKLSGDRCLMTFPPLWTKEGKSESAHRGEIPVEEAWDLQMEFVRQLAMPDD